MALSDSQKRRIDNILRGDKPIPADTTIGDVIKKTLTLDDEGFAALEGEIEEHVEAFFTRMSA